MNRVPPLDYAFLAFESDASPKHVSGMQIYTLPKGAPKNFISNLIKNIKDVEPVAPFDQLLHAPRFKYPEWRADPDFDVDQHVHREKLPSPCTEKALLERIATLHADKLERDRPLWKLHILAPYKRNSFVLFFKVHHAYMDGISLSKRAMFALNKEAEAPSTFSFWGDHGNSYHRERSSIASAVIGNAKKAGKAFFVLPALAKLGLKHSLRFARLSGRELPLPFTAPRTAFNTPLTSERSVALARISLARLRAVAHRAGVTINDVVLELCDSAMTRYLTEFEQVPEQPLVAQMPISLRQSEDGQGNQFGIALLELSSKETNPVARLQRIHSHARHAKEEFTTISAEAAEVYTLLLQGVAQFAETTGVGRFLPPLGNVVVSNLVGPTQQMYLAGARLRAVYPISTIAPGLAMNITTYSYNKSMYFGLVAGKTAIDDLEPLASYLESSMVELEVMMNLKSGKGTKIKRKRKVTTLKRRTAAEE